MEWRLLRQTLTACATLTGFVPLAIAQTASPAPLGKPLTIIYGASAGGALDLQAHLIARYIGKHLAGTPSVIVSSMPGAVATLPRHLYNVAPRDGSTIGVFFSSVLMQAKLQGEKDPTFDASKFSYLGSSFTDVPACMARRSVTAASLPDILSRELIAGALPAGTTGGDFTNVLAGLVGAKFRLVRGYPGFQGEALALEKGELDVVCVSWAAMKARYPDILSDRSEFRVILRGDDGQGSELAQAGVPTISSLPPNDLDRSALKWFMSQFAIASPFALPPNVPPAVAANLRRAFAETMSDEGFKSDATTLKAEVKFTSGEVVEETIDVINRAPPQVSERVRKALTTQP